MLGQGSGAKPWRHPNEGAGSIIETHDGGHAIAANIHVSGFIQDLYLLKIDAQGNEIWSHVYDLSYNDKLYGFDRTLDQGLFGVEIDDTQGGSNHNLVMRLDSNGTQFARPMAQHHRCR